MVAKASTVSADRWMQEHLFEEDVRAMVAMLPPGQRVEEWSEYRTGDGRFRATVSWSPDFHRGPDVDHLMVPRMVDVLETILVGSVKAEADLPSAEAFDLYRRVIRELHHRMDAMQACYE